MSKAKISVRVPLFILAILFTVSLFILWPGIISPDAAVQYAAAKAGVYTDHHPPIMSFVWRYLDQLYAGSGLILLMHMGMLYAAAAVFINLFKDSWFKWWYAIFPLIPNIVAYTPLIVKDVGFAYAYLLAGAIIAHLMVKKPKKNKYILIILALILLFYGTCVKFQARYLLIFFTLGIGYCLNYKLNWKSVLAGILLCAGLLQAMISFNTWLVPNSQESNSWQLVKLYDLAAISLDLDKPLFPEFVQQNADFSLTRIRKLFSPSEVDPLVFPEHSPLKGGTNAAQREELLNYWRATILQHPFLYLKHRARLWQYNLFSTPSGRSNPIEYFKNTNIAQWLYQPQVFNAIDAAYKTMQVGLQFIWLLFLLIIYTYLSYSRRHKSSYAPPLIMFCGTSWMLLGVLFFCSMAATSRYVFICTCLIHASHGFAYKCWRTKKGRK